MLRFSPFASARENELKNDTAPRDAAYDFPKSALPRVAVVLAMHALVLFTLIAGDRILRPTAPHAVMLLATVPPEIIKPPPQPSKPQAPAREGAAPPLRDTKTVPRTEVVATIADNALPVQAAGGKPEGTGTAGAGNTGDGDGGKAPVTVPALIDPANCERPKLPRYAERRHLSGDVILALLIGVDGKVAEARIARSSGTPILDQTALEGALQCHFVAATVDKVPVPSWEAFRFSWTHR